MKATDHLGNEYRSTTAMCAHYGISLPVYEQRLEKGWTKEKALTEPLKKPKPYAVEPVDHLGKVYSSLDEMCRVYDVPKGTFVNRLKRGWSLKNALTEPTPSRSRERERKGS